MINVEKQVVYWRDGALEDWQAAEDLVGLGRTRHGLFFAHLALEKMLKAHVCRVISDIPPRIHALLRLAERAELELSGTQRLFLARFDRYQLEGRYPDLLPAAPTMQSARAELEQAREMLEWLNRQL